MLLAVGILAVLSSARALGPEPHHLRPIVSALTLRPPGLVSKHLFQGLSFANPSQRCFGFLVPVLSSCTLNAPPFPDNRPFVPVLPASGCSVDEKIRSLVRNNASGIIVYRDDGYSGADLALYRSHFETPCIIILDRVSGELLMDKILDNNTKVIVHITPDDPDATAAAKRLIWVVGILVGFGVLLFLIRILQNCVSLRTRVAQAPCVTRSFKDMQRQAIDEIPVRQILTHEETKEQCSICLEGFIPGILVRTLKCRHEFHTDCIDEWLLRNRLCPLCKHPSYHMNLTLVSLESLLSSLGSEDGVEEVVVEERMEAPEPEEPSAE